jgi:protocatechuate 3,4-dioxygenase beta subunit
MPAWSTRAGGLVTPSQTEGPFYPPPELLRDTDADLVRLTGAAAQAWGVVTHVTGRLLDARGRPLPGHLVEIWQCDAHGHYLAEHGTSWSNWFRKREASDPRFQGYGRTMTSADGGYWFRTIRPVPYPGWTPHIHFKVGCCGRKLLTTQMYVAGEPGNERDGLIRHSPQTSASGSRWRYGQHLRSKTGH